jgi:hypothetical protein
MNIIDSKEENHIIDSFAHLCSRFAPHPRDPFFVTQSMLHLSELSVTMYSCFWVIF